MRVEQRLDSGIKPERGEPGRLRFGWRDIRRSGLRARIKIRTQTRIQTRIQTRTRTWLQIGLHACRRIAQRHALHPRQGPAVAQQQMGQIDRGRGLGFERIQPVTPQPVIAVPRGEGRGSPGGRGSQRGGR